MVTELCEGGELFALIRDKKLQNKSI
jgi:serine/threonine protein kinase